MIAEIEGLAAGIGMGAHQRVVDCGAAVVERGTKDDPQCRDPAFRLIRQRVIGQCRVGELGVAAPACPLGRHLDRAEHRQHRRRGVVRLVGVPVVIGGFRDPDCRLAVGIEVRHHMRDVVPLAFATMRAMHLDFAEICREGELPLPAQQLLREDDDVMREKRRDDRILDGR